MSSRYRIIHFTPDPASGMRIPVGALVEKDGAWMVARAPHLPGAGCVGGLRAHSAMQLALEALGEDPLATDQLPLVVGPHLELDEVRQIPRITSDPMEWVIGVLPQRLSDPADLQRGPKGPRRDTAGKRFFETHGVDQFVKNRYRPEMIAGVSPFTVSDITHYVLGRERVLLMEPLLATRSQFDDDLTEVSQAFLAWQQLLEIKRSPREPVFYAYLLRANEKAADQARKALALSHATVVHVDHEIQRINFVQTIRDVGVSGLQQGDLI